MSVISNFRRTRWVFLLGVCMAQHGASAEADTTPIYFQAVSLPAAEAPAPGLADASVEQASFAAFEPTASIESIREEVAMLEDSGDAFSPLMAEQAAELGKALQSQGQHDAALQAFDRSLQIMRRQEGLYSAAQTAILQAQIASQLALGDMDASDALQQTRFSMQQQLYAENPVRLAEAHTAWADWNLRYYLNARQLSAGSNSAEQATALAERLSLAFVEYHNALWQLSNSESSAAAHYDAKVALERKIAAITLLVDGQYQRNLRSTLTTSGQPSPNQAARLHHGGLINHGSSALQRAIGYSVAISEPPLIAERQLELADWQLLLDQHEEARASYRQAVTVLNEAGVPEQQIASMLGEGLPVRNPADDLIALAWHTDVSAFEGYIDVSFDVNSYGHAANTRVLAGASYDDAVQKALLDRIHEGRFRPGFDAGVPVERKDVTLRYYFAR